MCTHRKNVTTTIRVQATKNARNITTRKTRKKRVHANYVPAGEKQKRSKKTHGDAGVAFLRHHDVHRGLAPAGETEELSKAVPPVPVVVVVILCKRDARGEGKANRSERTEDKKCQDGKKKID